MSEIFFIKWGGSLITDKDKAFTPRTEIIQSLAKQLKEIIELKPEVNLILGHGSGSFGHVVANEYKTRSGVKTQEEWLGFTKVWDAARKLNILITQALHDQNIPTITFPPSTFMTSSNGIAKEIFHKTIDQAIAANLIPVVHGDVIFDNELGGTILSTEDIFIHLANIYKPAKILLAGIEPYIWADYPKKTIPIKSITTRNFDQISSNIQGSDSVDVTGGMYEKVRIMLDLARKYPETKISIFSGFTPNCLIQEILGHSIGTTIQLE